MPSKYSWRDFCGSRKQVSALSHKCRSHLGFSLVPRDEREELLGITRRGKSSGRKVKRALILCKADEGLTDQQVAEALMVGPSTVGQVRQRFVEGGLERALNDLPRPGQRRKLET